MSSAGTGVAQIGQRTTLNQADRSNGRLGAQIKSAAEGHGVELPDGWKPETARRIVVTWSMMDAPKSTYKHSGQSRDEEVILPVSVRLIPAR